MGYYFTEREQLEYDLEQLRGEFDVLNSNYKLAKEELDSLRSVVVILYTVLREDLTEEQRNQITDLL